jgi:hypothetical protein
VGCHGRGAVRVRRDEALTATCIKLSDDGYVTVVYTVKFPTQRNREYINE